MPGISALFHRKEITLFTLLDICKVPVPLSLTHAHWQVIDFQPPIVLHSETDTLLTAQIMQKSLQMVRESKG